MPIAIAVAAIKRDNRLGCGREQQYAGIDRIVDQRRGRRDAQKFGKFVKVAGVCDGKRQPAMGKICNDHRARDGDHAGREWIEPGAARQGG